jgi:hypothetical protein
MHLNRCNECIFHKFNEAQNSMACLKGDAPYFLIPKRLVDFLFYGWVANCDNYHELTQSFMLEMLEQLNVDSYQTLLYSIYKPVPVVAKQVTPTV